MSEDTYAKIDLTKKVRFQTEKKDTDAEKTDHAIIYDNCWVGNMPAQLQDTTEDQQKTISVNAPSAKRDLFRPAIVLLVLLYLLLMGLVIVVTVLWIQDRSLNINLTSERDQLQTSYTEVKNLTVQLQNNISVVTKDRDHFKKQLEACPPRWLKVESSCFLITTLRENWHTGKQYCENKGAHLPIISSKEIQVFLSFYQLSWIGLTDQEEEGVWRWVDGTKANEMYWQGSQPDNWGSKERCAQIRFPGLENWNDVSCYNICPVICQNNTVTLFN